MPEIWASTPGTFCTSAERTCRWTVLDIEKAENLLWVSRNNGLAEQPRGFIIILALKSSKGIDLRPHFAQPHDPKAGGLNQGLGLRPQVRWLHAKSRPKYASSARLTIPKGWDAWSELDTDSKKERC